ncbi:MAG: ATP-binding protein [Candidatus Acidiferrales bacterium]
MSLLKLGPVAAAGAPLNSKIHSTEHRFRVMQAATTLVALLLMGATLLIGLRFHMRQKDRITELQSSLSLLTRIRSVFRPADLAFWKAYMERGTEQERQYQLNSQDMRDRTVDLSRRGGARPEARAEIALLIGQEQQYLLLTQGLLAGSRNESADRASLSLVGEKSSAISATLRQLEEDRLQSIAVVNSDFDRLMIELGGMLLFFATLTFLVEAWFLRAYREDLWQPLGELRRMVREVSRGNLEVSAKIPRSLELGSLTNGFIAMARELLRQREGLEERVRERTAELECSHRELLQAAKLSSLGQLVAGVAHEINNPLTAVLGFTEISLSRPEIPDTVRAYLLKVRDESLRIKNLIAGLNTFARRAPQRIETLDLRRVVDRLCELQRYQLTAKNVRLHTLVPAEPVWVRADAEQLLQVLLNLVLNSEQAIRAVCSSGDIWLRVGCENGRAWAEVEDNGCGVALELRSSIFDPFFTTKPQGEGTGLGLSISHGIVEQHGGEFRVSSDPGKGTTMRFLLPQAAAPLLSADAGRNIAASEFLSAISPKSILVIDDEREILELVGRALDLEGIESTLLDDPAKLESALASADFDLVLCDRKMPGRSGLDVFRVLKAERPALAQRFLLMTGNLSDMEDPSPELDGVPVLRKPFTLARLREFISADLRAELADSPSRSSSPQV